MIVKFIFGNVFVQDYRKGHHFSLASGSGKGTWKVKRLGSIRDGSYKSSGNYLHGSYTFFLPLYGGFGYSLGSTFGYFSESKSKSEVFDAASAINLPGIGFGLNYNINPGFRIFGSISYGISRINGLIEKDGIYKEGDPDDPEISITLNRFSLVSGLDYFFSLNWAVRFEYHEQFLKYNRPVISDGDPIDVDASLSKNEHWVGVSLMYHFL